MGEAGGQPLTHTPVEYRQAKVAHGPMVMPAWVKWLLAYVATVAAVCVASIAGIRYGQRKYGSTVIFEPAIGTSFYDDWFILLPGDVLVGSAIVCTLLGGILLARQGDWRGAACLALTVWGTCLATGFAMVAAVWEPASP